jgi:hypothetical protein
MRIFYPAIKYTPPPFKLFDQNNPSKSSQLENTLKRFGLDNDNKRSKRATTCRAGYFYNAPTGYCYKVICCFEI